jgi:hypothetical protein
MNPTTAREPGSGRARFYPASEIGIAHLVARLLADGVSPATAFRVARELADHGHSTVAGIRIDLPQET